MKRILNIANRTYPRQGLFKAKYKNDIYFLDEYKEDIDYYENTPLEVICFDGKHDLTWGFFTVEGIDYLLPRILVSIQTELDDLPVIIEDFIVNMTLDVGIKQLVRNLPISDLLIIQEILENILFGKNIKAISLIGEHYLFLNLEYIENILNNKR